MKTKVLIILLTTMLLSCLSNNNEINYVQNGREYPDINFTYPNSSSEYMQVLKSRLPIEIYKNSNDFETVLAVKSYVQSLWLHDGMNKSAQFDPIYILDEVAKGERFRCVEYGIVTVGFLNSIGLTARVVALKTEDVETRKSGAGHVISEVYLNSLQKWIMVDSNFGVIPTKNGIPLNTYEFQQAIINGDELDELSAAYNGKKMSNREYIRWIKPYLYYIDTVIEDGKRKKIMLVPINASNPVVFQRKNPIRDMLYTHSLEDFYQPPMN